MSANLTELTEIVYLTIFPPDGRIPLKAKANLPAIDSRIKEIEKLAAGKVLEGQGRRISDKVASQMLTQQIVQLRDSCSPPMGYREIMRQLGDQITPDAARNRYDDFKRPPLRKESYKAISGAIYTTPPEEQQKNMARTTKHKDSLHPEPTTNPSLPGVEGAPETARANPRGSPEEKPPAPTSISRADLNIKIWDAWQNGNSPERISQDLNAEGYYYDTRQVTNRLRQQGAPL